MIQYSRYFLLVFALAFFVQSCTSSSEETRQKKREISDDQKDSIALIYDSSNADKKIDDYINNLHRKSSFNGNVLIAKNGKIIYEKAIGWADYLHRDSLEIDSKFELASVSKPFTSAAVLMLVEDGKIRLDQQVKDFYPNFPYDSITVKMLLTHRSGMMNYVYFIDDIWRKEKRDQKAGVSNQEVMRIIAEKKPNPYSKPGNRFHYNNSNYMVLAAIVEKVSGQKFSEFMADNIFKPLGMKNTAVYSRAEYDKIPVDVVGHDRTWRRSVVQNFLDGPVGDKGVYSTVKDLYLFDRALRTDRLLKKSTLDSAYAPHNKMERGHFNYGYGWRTFQNEENRVVYHTGWWHGFRHIYLRQLDKDITIIMLTNLTNASLHRLDDLYKMVGMPVVRRSAYSGSGVSSDDDEQ